MNNDEIKTILLSYYGNYFLTTSYSADHIKNKLGPSNTKISSQDTRNQSREEIFYSGLDKTIELLLKTNKKIILSIDIPELAFFPKDCVRKQMNCNTPIQEVMDRQAALRAMINKLKKHYPMLLVYDPLPLFCQNNECTFQHKSGILYRDSHHLTLRGSDFYAQNFIDWLNQH